MQWSRKILTVELKNSGVCGGVKCYIDSIGIIGNHARLK